MWHGGRVRGPVEQQGAVLECSHNIELRMTRDPAASTCR